MKLVLVLALAGCGRLAAAPSPAHESVCARPRADILPQGQTRTLIHAGKLFDGVTMQNDVDLLIEADRIIAVGPSLAVTGTVEQLDLRAFTVLPGLIDVHTHLLHPG